MPPARKLSTKGMRGAQLRVVQYLNDTFGGNVLNAAGAIGCNYDQLYRIVHNRNPRPNVAVLVALERHSGRSISWWIHGGLVPAHNPDLETVL